jgi:hypothetical protein
LCSFVVSLTPWLVQPGALLLEFKNTDRALALGSVPKTPKDLRDTFASWLVSLGAPVAWVSESLGHANWAVTARHYARWVDDAARQPVTPLLDSGDLWPDLLARAGTTSTPDSTPMRLQTGSRLGG